MQTFRRRLLFQRLVLPAAVVAAAGLTATAAAAETMENIVSVGTRSQGRMVSDSPVPVDVLSSETLQSTGQIEVGRMLQSVAPSFNFSSSTISDGTDALRPATLRGLGPDQTLVLVNGKRRHTSALIHVNTSVGRGTAGTDMNAIPGSSIGRIEVLRDGASAQYGSDAIAGVINIVLKDEAEAGQVAAYYGQYTKGDGGNILFSLNKGFGIGNDGFINFDAEYRNRGKTNRAGLTGVCQYDSATDNTCTDIGGGVQQTTDPREIIFNRKNFRIGDAESEQIAGTINLSIPLDNGLELYGFATASNRKNESAGFYRRANQDTRNPVTRFDGVTLVNDGAAYYPDGFLPLINTTIDDYSVNGGLRGELAGWDWDASLGYGMNDFNFFISNSINASLVSAVGRSPTSADAGTLSLGLFTLDFDITKDQSWGNLAFGAAYRMDSYEIKPGELVSYADFDTIGGVSLGPFDAAAGIQVFPGFSPMNRVDENRDAWSLYADVEYDAIDRLLLGGALRYENYSDFGDTITGKLTGAFDVTDTFRIRGSASTGFRAPSLQQQFFNNTSTQFVGGIAQQRGTFRNDSALARAIGIPKLKEETSVNLSAGFIWEPIDRLSITVDYYNIQIDDRIVISGAIEQGLDPVLDAALIAANADSAQFFLNAVDTSTEGVDILANYGFDMLGGDLDLTLAANFTDTDIDAIKPPDKLSSIPGIQDKVFTPQDQSILTEWQPQNRVNLSANYSRSRWSLLVAAQEYGKYTIEDAGERQTFGAKVLIDTQFSLNVTDHLALKIGGNNIFDETPDKNRIGQARGGTIVDGNGNVIVDSPGVFKYSRRAAPFGFNGAYWYGQLDFFF